MKLRNVEIISKPEVRIKGWGFESIIHDGDDYCGKVLNFNPDRKFSMHYHVKKRETWYVAKGSFTLIMINPDTAEKVQVDLVVGDVVEVHRGISHQLIAKEQSAIFEVSTPDDIQDSYRVEKGDSQKEMWFNG
jgi:mannose-6-phosphate isomerase-like protein (cupin superfamily)